MTHRLLVNKVKWNLLYSVLLTRRTGDRRDCTSSVFLGPLDGGYWGRHHEVSPPTPSPHPPQHVIPHLRGCLVHWTGVNVWRPLACSYEGEHEWEVGSLEIHAKLVSTVLQLNTAFLKTQQNLPTQYNLACTNTVKLHQPLVLKELAVQQRTPQCTGCGFS